MQQTSKSPAVGKMWLIPALRGGAACALVGTLLLGCGPRQEQKSPNLTADAADGLPHTFAELNAWYVEPPAQQNAATCLSQGFGVMQIPNAASSPLPLLGKGALPPLGSPMAASMKSTLTAFLHSNRDALQLFAEGANCQTCRYSLDLTRGNDAVFPHLPKLRTAVRLLELSAIVHAESKDGNDAAQDVLTALGLSRSLEAEPSTLSQFMRAADVAIAVAALEQTLNRTVLSRESLGTLMTALHKMEDYDARGEGFNRALVAERVMMAALLATPQKLLEFLQGAPATDLPAEQRNQIAARLQAAKDLKEEQHYLDDTVRQLIAIRQSALPDRLKAVDLVRQRVAEAVEKKLMVLVWLLPGFEKQAAQEAGCLASLRLGLTAVALERFRAAHENRYPDNLAALSPDFLGSTPADPFDGQPLRYRKKGDGYSLYCIGPDLKDNAGERMKENKGDIVFAVVGPATQRN